MVTTTISCDATILRCDRCLTEVAIARSATATPGTCVCGTQMTLDRSCDQGLALHEEGALIRCVAENRDRWYCADRGGRDFCPAHAHLADRRRTIAA